MDWCLSVGEGLESEDFLDKKPFQALWLDYHYSSNGRKCTLWSRHRSLKAAKESD